MSTEVSHPAASPRVTTQQKRHTCAIVCMQSTHHVANHEALHENRMICFSFLKHQVQKDNSKVARSFLPVGLIPHGSVLKCENEIGLGWYLETLPLEPKWQCILANEMY